MIYAGITSGDHTSREERSWRGREVAFALSSRAYLVRPDGYVAASSIAPDTDPRRSDHWHVTGLGRLTAPLLSHHRALGSAHDRSGD